MFKGTFIIFVFFFFFSIRDSRRVPPVCFLCLNSRLVSGILFLKYCDCCIWFYSRSRTLTNILCWVLFIGISVIGLSCWSSGTYDYGCLNCRPRKRNGVRFYRFWLCYRLVFFMSRVNISNWYCDQSRPIQRLNHIKLAFRNHTVHNRNRTIA